MAKHRVKILGILASTGGIDAPCPAADFIVRMPDNSEMKVSHWMDAKEKVVAFVNWLRSNRVMKVPADPKAAYLAFNEAGSVTPPDGCLLDIESDKDNKNWYPRLSAAADSSIIEAMFGEATKGKTAFDR